MDARPVTHQPPRVTTIIPTLCEFSRKQSILRAIESIKTSSINPIRILILVNGQRYDKTLLGDLHERDDLDVIQIQEGSLTLAHSVGRRNVATEFFSFLDDDDEYLPEATDRRLVIIDSDSQIDLVVSNGFINTNGLDSVLYSRMQNVPHDPLHELFRENWLHNCNALFRTSSISLDYFENPHKLMEWTWLAFKLALDGKKIGISDHPAFRYNDTPGSLSKSIAFAESRIKLYERMLKFKLPIDVNRTINLRLNSAWHNLSDIQRKDEAIIPAIRSHFYSIISHPMGFRYIPSTRHLLASLLHRRPRK